MTLTPPILEIDALSIGFATDRGDAQVVSGVSLTVGRNEVVGVIGESGSGKTLTAIAVLGLLPARAQIHNGDIRLNGQSVLALSSRERRKLLGVRIAYIPQDAMRALNPTMKIGDQVGEPFLIHRNSGWKSARRKAIELLRSVHLSDPQTRAADFPHQFSGGMQQRAMISMGIALNPQLLIADEPTTALDVTVQAQVINLLREVRDSQGSSILFISHDLGLVVDFCERVYVMYAGNVVEQGAVKDIFERPAHPYTQALLDATPSVSHPRSVLQSIPGQVPPPGELPAGCLFSNRCAYARSECQQAPPFKVLGETGHHARCWFAGETR